MGSVLIPCVNKPTEGPCRLLKNVRWGTLLPLDVVSKKGTNSPDPRIPRLHHVFSIRADFPKHSQPGKTENETYLA